MSTEITDVQISLIIKANQCNKQNQTLEQTQRKSAETLKHENN